ncbi:hypothetical protein COU80_02775 [Candidatus Peregrinibacteria bacterium CG10_big_fil_rev_8_21_14_0_10_55_24]|nr:MAG: hypothetical protein COU80_02775 [Candidatus Peregrinibacteria bacterium CG10_big_fil_rev_8_21_14_0_10_55_24]
MEKSGFITVAKEAVEALPSHIRAALTDMVIIIEDRPSQEWEAIHRGKLLLGLYQGIPLTEWGRTFSGKLPDKIMLFREPIEQVAGSEVEVPRVIRETVWHEIGHHFGLDHKRIGKMEQRWRKNQP